MTLRQKWLKKKYLKSAATCTEKAVYYKSCTVCGEKGMETFEVGNILGHDWGEWQPNGNGTHARVCKRNATHKGNRQLFRRHGDLSGKGGLLWGRAGGRRPVRQRRSALFAVRSMVSLPRTTLRRKWRKKSI